MTERLPLFEEPTSESTQKKKGAKPRKPSPLNDLDLGEWRVILDAFLGSGTSLIECRRLGRHGIGIELKPELAGQASERIASQGNPYEDSPVYNRWRMIN